MDLKDIVIAKAMFGGSSEGGGGGTSYTTLFEGSVTTEDDGEIISGDIGINISGSPLKITFDGVEYTCEQEYDFYGGFDGDYSVYPFCIYTDGFIKTQTAGTHTLKIEAPQSGGSSDFSTAEVTIPNEGGTSNVQYSLPIIQDNVSIVARVMQRDDEQTFNTVLYKGALVVYTGEDIVISGSAEYDDDTGFTTITGNCTLKGFVIY